MIKERKEKKKRREKNFLPLEAPYDGLYNAMRCPGNPSIIFQYKVN